MVSLTNTRGFRGNQLALLFISSHSCVSSRLLLIKAEAGGAEEFLRQLRRDALVSRLWDRSRTSLSTTPDTALHKVQCESPPSHTDFAGSRPRVQPNYTGSLGR